MNYMINIADMLGVELYETFIIEGFEDTDFKLTANGLFYYDNRTLTWEKSLLLDDILIGTRKIIKSVLTIKEKDYLLVVIEPFRDKVNYIVKQAIDVSEKSPAECITIYFDGEKTILPSYERGKMYRGMKLMEKYTIEDLGL